MMGGIGTRRSRRSAACAMLLGSALTFPLLPAGAAPARAAVTRSSTAATAGAETADPPSLPGQVGPATAYTTPHGTAAWRYYVNAGDPADAYHYAQVAVPASLDPSTPTPTVLAVHGATATEDQLFVASKAATGGNAVLNSWLDRGWPVIATREGETVKVNKAGKKVGTLGRWGNEASAAGMADAWLWAQSAWTPDAHGFLVYGWSMGGVGALNFAAEAERRGYPVAAVDIVDGATNLRYDYAHRAAFASNIRAAYQLPAKTTPGDAAWETNVDAADGGHDPQIAAATWQPFPLRMSASGNDPTVRKTDNSELLFATLAASGWPSTAELSYLSYTGGHCAASHFRPADVDAFFDRSLAVPIIAAP